MGQLEDKTNNYHSSSIILLYSLISSSSNISVLHRPSTIRQPPTVAWEKRHYQANTKKIRRKLTINTRYYCCSLEIPSVRNTECLLCLPVWLDGLRDLMIKCHDGSAAISSYQPMSSYHTVTPTTAGYERSVSQSQLHKYCCCNTKGRVFGSPGSTGIPGLTISHFVVIYSCITTSVPGAGCVSSYQVCSSLYKCCCT